MPDIDPIIHPINRLKICATLNGVGATRGTGVHKEMRFGVLRDVVGVSDATLSKQLDYLEEAGYVRRIREFGSSRAKDTVWVQMTNKGKRAYDDHVAALRDLV